MSGPIVRGLTSIIAVPGTATKVTVDQYGRVTVLGSLTASDIPSLDGAIIASGTVSAARLGVMTGDTGAGGAKGAVPAPATGDAAKFLRGDATWATPADTGITQLTGDVTAGPGSGSQATTLATVNSNVGSFALATVTVNAKGLVTAASAASTTGTGNVVLASNPTIVGPTIAKLANLTTNGFVKTGSGDGTLSIDTSTYITGNQTITLSGDVTGSGTTAITTAVNWAAPGTIGSTTPSTGAFTTLSGLVTDAVTNANTDIATISHKSSGTPAASFGTGVLVQADSSNNTLRSMGRLRWLWTTATDGSQAARGVLSSYNGATENAGLSWNATGRVEIGTGTAFPSNLNITGGSGFTAFRILAANNAAPLQIVHNNGSNVVVNVALTGVTTIAPRDAATNAVTDALILDHSTTGTPTTAYGTGVLVRGQDSTTASVDMFAMRTNYTTATHASRATQTDFQSIDAAATRTVISVGANGSASVLGFYAATPIAQPTTAVAGATLVSNGGTALTSTDTFDGYTLQQLVRLIRNLGLAA